jgi:cardiolipin synthase
MLENKKELVKSGKKGIFRVIFSRTAILVLLIIVQIFLLFLGFKLLEKYVVFLYGGSVFLSAILVIHIINKDENSAFKLAWIILILVFPVFGALLYLFVELQFGTKLLNARLNKLTVETKEFTEQKPWVMEHLEKENEQIAHLSKYVHKYAQAPIYQNTFIKYFSLGEEMFEELKIQLEKAQSFIFMEFFIVEEGYMWNIILDILKRKVREGVEVRFMYDGMCSMVLLPYNYPKKLEKYGIKSKMFSPIKPALSTHQNNRDHRKIVVIDGHTAFTGGVNLADEYINRKVRFGHWKDTAIMLKGEAVESFTVMFLNMWNVTERMGEDYERYLKVSQLKIPNDKDGYVMPYGDSPLDSEQVAETVYMDVLNTANQYVHIMTPYLILDNELLTALKYAAKRGVEVIIIMPHKPDKWYAFALAKTYYDELIKAGVQIYEYTPGFIHAKSFTSDGEKAVIGSVNMDFRSLYLHFECAVFMYKNQEVKAMEEDFQMTLLKCQRITIKENRKRNFFMKIFGQVIRIIAPLM